MSTENDFVKETVYLNKELGNKVTINLNKSFLHGNKLFPKQEVNMTLIKYIANRDNLNIDDDDIDIVRTTHEYAKKFNEVVTTVLNDNEESAPYMLCATDGFSFIGEAFLNFVSALVIYDMFPNQSSSVLTKYANMVRNNEYITRESEDIDLVTNISKLRKIQRSTKQHCKEVAIAYKALIGALYKKNGNDKIMEIMRFVNRTVLPFNMIDFSGKEASTFIKEMLIFGSGLLFGWSVCYATFITTPNTCFMDLSKSI